MGGARSLLIALAALLWSADALFRLPLTRDLSATAIVFAEHALAIGFIVYFIARGWQQVRTLTARQWWALAYIGIAVSALATVAFTASFSYVSPSVAILLQKTQPLFTFLLAFIWLKEKLPKGFWWWAFLAIVGAYFVSFPEVLPQLAIYSGGMRGVIYALIAAALWGSATVFGRYLLNSVPVPLVTALRFALALPILAIMLATQGGFHEYASISGRDVLFLILIMLGPGFGAMYLYYRGLKVTRASVSALLELTWPLAAVVLNWFVLHETLGAVQIIGGLVLLFAIARITVWPSVQPDER